LPCEDFSECPFSDFSPFDFIGFLSFQLFNESSNFTFVDVITLPFDLLVELDCVLCAFQFYLALFRRPS
jgi:hypothetical protein